MSRIGLQPIEIPAGVNFDLKPGSVTVKGGKGELNIVLPSGLAISQEGSEAQVERVSEDRHSRAMHGTVRSLIANAAEGVSKGFEKTLEIQGVGYRAALQGRELVLNLGFSHAINFPVPNGIEVKMEGQTGMTISGIDKQLVGQVAAQIRAFSPAEPYKGKGVRYKGEQVRRKVGKAVS